MEPKFYRSMITGGILMTLDNVIYSVHKTITIKIDKVEDLSILSKHFLPLTLIELEYYNFNIDTLSFNEN